MIRAFCIFVFLAWGPVVLFATDSELGWEKPVPEGVEKDIIALNRLVGNERGAKYMEDRYKERKLEVAFKPFSPSLNPKKKVALFTVSPAMDFPDVLGGGTFYLICDNNRYFILTKQNLARLYAPLENTDEVLRFITIFQELFLNRFADIIMEKSNPYKVEAFTSVEKASGGFKVRLVTHNGLHHAYVAQEDFFVGNDASVKSVKELKIIKDIGEGYVF